MYNLIVNGLVSVYYTSDRYNSESYIFHHIAQQAEDGSTQNIILQPCKCKQNFTGSLESSVLP